MKDLMLYVGMYLDVAIVVLLITLAIDLFITAFIADKKIVLTGPLYKSTDKKYLIKESVIKILCYLIIVQAAHDRLPDTISIGVIAVFYLLFVGKAIREIINSRPIHKA